MRHRTPGPDDVPQADLVEELSLNRYQMKGVRRDHLTTDDWYKIRQTIWLTAEGQRKLRIWAEVRNDAAHIAHHFVEGYVLHPLPHPEWLEVRIKNGLGEWIKVACRVPRRIKYQYTHGKRIRIEVVQSCDVTGYRHESYANYTEKGAPALNGCDV